MLHYCLSKIILTFVLYTAWTYANDSAPLCNIARLDIKTTDNPFIESLVSEIILDDPENLINLTFVVKEEIPTDILQIILNVTMNGQQVGYAQKDFCDIFDDDMIGKDLVEHGVDEFPENCPIPPGEHKIAMYKLDTKKVNGVPDGKFEGVVTIMDSSEEIPYVLIEFAGELFH